MSNEKTIVSKITEILDIDPQTVVNDARDYGLNVETIQDLGSQPQNYVFIEKLMEKYAMLAASYCAMSGATSGVGGPFTAISMAGVDIANMAAQLYRLNQKMAILNGFDIENSVHMEKAHLIYLAALGFDGVAQAAIRSQIAKAAAENLSKRGPAANVTIRLIMEVAKLLGLRLTKTQAVKLIPLAGAVLGGGMNYIFAETAAKKMIAEYKSDYFDRWQMSVKQH